MSGKVADWFSASDDNRWFTHPTLLSIAALAALLMVAAGVYSIAARATDVTRHAEATTALTESLRISSTMRSDVSTITVLNRVEQSGIDATAARDDLFDSLTMSVGGLSELQADIAKNAGNMEVASALATFIAAATAVIDQEADEASVTTFDANHSDLTAQVVARRDVLVRALEDDATAMRRTGSTTSYVVAFIVPAIALYVFEALRRIRLRSKLTQQANDGLRRRAQASAALDADDLGQLEDHAASLIADARIEQPHLRAHLDGIRRSSAALRTRAIARGAALTTTLGPIDIDESIRRILDEAGLGHLDFVSSLDGKPALADAKNLRFALRELLANAFAHGSEPIRLKAYAWNDTITITISDRGPGLPEELKRVVFLGDVRSMREDIAMAGAADGLVAVRSLIEAMGGSFEYEREDDATLFVLRLKPSDIEQGDRLAASVSL